MFVIGHKQQALANTTMKLGFDKLRAVSELNEKLRDYQDTLGPTNTLHDRSPCIISQTVKTTFVN